MPSAPQVRVGIVSWNTADYLERCLHALPSALDGMAAEIVVIDNASDDDSAARAEAHEGVRVIRNPSNVGYARAMNQALSDSTAPVLIALNPDTEPSAGSLRRLVDSLLAESDVALVAPQLRNDDGSLQHSVNRFPSVRLSLAGWILPSWWHARRQGRSWWVPGSAAHAVAEDIDWAIGAVHVIRAEALADSPPYSERWFMYVEDLDLCWRLAGAGWRRKLVPDVQVTHTANVAGAQAWGPDTAVRWLPCSYDFYALTHSGLSSRLYAGSNIVAVLTWSFLGLIKPSWGPGLPPAGRRSHLGRVWRLRSQLRIHAAALFFGPAVMARRGARPGVEPASPLPPRESSAPS
jgi:N-acetylglucosaminyl-diphospho-decaprenol L-rhamnosyltransferase